MQISINSLANCGIGHWRKSIECSWKQAGWKSHASHVMCSR